MSGIILHDEDVYRLAQSVNTKQTEGYAPMGGILANNGMYYQPMVTGTVTAPYVVVREQESQNFTSRAATTTASGLGDIQYVDGFFLQAFGEEPGGGAVTVAWGDVTGKPAFIAAGASASAARSAIGAVAIGTTAGTAMDGSKTLANIGGVVPTSGLPAASTTVAGIIQIGTGATQAMAGNKTLANIGGVVPASGIPAAGAARGGVLLGVAVPNAAAAPTMAEFNALLASLRTAGVIAP